ncbi:hypothetical protein AVEN_48326-1 [Araneus ventricosus]|uniref:Uncharacterized protein n=1 Tax=Araneus ventricosus TaxID=182803 RepID=A0A4Y2M1I8_ARAVE|nr:hypothetical protein AVEN_48326-1 [Araneus ventricosus]
MAYGFPVKSGRYGSSDTEVRALIAITGHGSDAFRLHYPPGPSSHHRPQFNPRRTYARSSEWSPFVLSRLEQFPEMPYSKNPTGKIWRMAAYRNLTSETSDSQMDLVARLHAVCASDPRCRNVMTAIPRRAQALDMHGDTLNIRFKLHMLAVDMFNKVFFLHRQ